MNLLLAALLRTTWAMEPAALERAMAIIERHAAGIKLDALAVEAAVADAPRAAAERRSSAASADGSVAVIPVFGTIAHRAHMVNQVSGPGGTSSELLGRTIRAAAADPSISAIVLDVDSPGGAVDGTPEVVDAIYEARSAKPIVAVANSLAASAAYWIASAANEISVTPSGTVGSIGVMAIHRHQADAETVTTIIHAGKYKAEGHPSVPLSDDARAHAQSLVDTCYAQMIRSIARNRGVSPDAVRSGYGEGRTFLAEEAKSRGMVDRIETLDEAIARVSNPRRRANVGSRARSVRLAELS